MSRIARVAFDGVFIALLLGCQFALSGIVGIEIITPLLLSHCFHFGILRGTIVASAFSCLRCLVFGFSPTALILYLLYYNLFAVVFGLLGRWRRDKLTVSTFAVLTVTAVLCTALFTLLDDVITPVFYGYTLAQAKVYFIASLAALVPHCLCSAVTVPLLVPPLLRAYAHLNAQQKS